MCFFIKNDDLLKKCNAIWDNASTAIKKEFDSKCKDFLKTKIKSDNDEATDFKDKEMPKEKTVIILA